MFMRAAAPGLLKNGPADLDCDIRMPGVRIAHAVTWCTQCKSLQMLH